MTKEKKVCSFNRVMTLEDAEREKKKGTPIGESLKKADREYDKRRRSE